MKALFLISDLAKTAETTIDAVRFYEKKGLIKPVLKAENGYRYYDQQGLNRLIFIKNCRNVDLSIDEISQLLTEIKTPQNDCHQVNDLIDHHIAMLDNKIQQLQQFKMQLSSIRKTCDGVQSVDECLILKEFQIKK